MERRVKVAAARLQNLCSLASLLLFFLLLTTDVAASVEVHFESKDGGFFLKHSPRQYYPSNVRPDLSLSSIFSTTSASTSASGSSSSSSSTSNGQQAASSILSVDKFTVFQTSEPVSVRATYGPFSTKQTVPARYIVPDPLDVLPAQNFEGKKGLSSSNATLRDVQEIGARHLDMSAHVVSSSIPRDSPVLRVLFHAGSEATGRRQLLLGRQQRVCVLLHATPSIAPRAAAEAGSDFVSGPLTAACTPDGQDGVCLAQITIPASWWPPLPPPDSAGRVKLVKTLPRTVQLSYSVLEPRGPEDGGSSSSQGSSHHTLDSGSDSSAASSFCQPRVQIQPITPLGQVTLVPNRATYKELKTDEYLTLLVPHGPLYPRSRLHIPVFLQSHSSKQATQGRPPVAAVVLRARVKAGVKILDASTSSPDWIVETDINTKNTAATFTARRKENISRLPNASAEEIMTMLLEASEESAESKEHGGGGRIVWSVRYALEGEEDNVSLSGPFQLTQPHQQQQMQQQQQPPPQQYQQQQPLQHHHHHNGPSDRKKLQAHLEIQKDDIQAVLPISKNWEVINTAVLTGRQISQAMKVFIVSQAGTVADVTLQSSCHSEDESVLKVSSSCSSVYVDGSEIRGSSNASVLVKYGTYTGLARFTVWMPEFPLEVSVVDTRLNQIKGWKVPEDNVLAKNKRSSLSSDLNSIVSRADGKKLGKIKRKRSAALAEQPQMAKDDEADYEDEDEEEEEDDEDEEGEEEIDEPEAMGAASGKMRFRSGDKWDEINAIDRSSASSSCRLRFQQSPVEVHARFLAADHDSGRVSYFVNRRTWLRVTDLVAGLLRVSDPRIATLLQGRIVQGRGIGRTEVQVLSPITGRVIGAREVRVGNDRVAITQLSVKVVSGLQLSITPDSAIENGYVAETSVTRKLTAQYQEGLLDIDIEFSDGARTPLREIAVSNYQLVVESLDPDVVAFAPMAASHHPRVIAVGEGRGELLRVSLQLADACRSSGRRGKSSSSPQARASTASSSSTSSASSSSSSNVATPLASATANVEVDFASSDLPSRPEFVQNDGGGNLGLSAHHRERKAGSREMAPDLHDILIGMGGVGIRPNTDHHMTPLEIGMYVLLAAFCFAIVVFVGACVVYASKLKPVSPTNPESAALPVLEAARAAASQFASNHNLRPNRQPRESTTNAHDWVWLGRATLERAACAPQQVRVTSNPLAAEPEEEALNSFDNPHHVELPPARSSSSASAPIDSTTYCKRDRQHRGLSSKSSARSTSHLRDNGNNETTAPPLPPHKISSAMSDNGNEDYKPPVPPHRGSRLMPETPKRHRHHHHQRAASSSSNNASAAAAAPASNASNGSDHHVPRSRHESSKHHHHRSKSGRSRSSSNSAAVSNDVANDKDKNSNADEIFIEVRGKSGRSRDAEIRHKRGRSRESKRATVVGNPMFVSSDSSNNSSSGNASQNDNNQQQQQPLQEASASSIIAPTTGGSTLDELNLDMDYNQIMQYFDNLKESNA